MRISDWSSDVCSSDLIVARLAGGALVGSEHLRIEARGALVDRDALLALLRLLGRARISRGHLHAGRIGELLHGVHEGEAALIGHPRSEEHTSELQSLMRISYAVFCLKKTTNQPKTHT